MARSDVEDEGGAWDELPAVEVLSPREMLDQMKTVNALAPLVRCSKLPFRHLCSLYETHITHTPMMLAEEFSRSQTARLSDFTTSKNERGVFWMEPSSSAPSSSSQRPSSSESSPSTPTTTPSDLFSSSRRPPTPTPPTKHSRLVRGCLVAQFASPNATSLADAAELISAYVDSIDINCGCPQRWAYHEGIGCALLRKPELVRDMIRSVHGRLGWDFGVSIKIRIDPDPKMTEQLIKLALQTNVSHITIHGRTRFQASTEPISMEGIKFAVECVGGAVPTMANGDVWEYADGDRLRKDTGVRGVMGARGLLANPALFAGYKRTPRHAVENFCNLSVDYGFISPLFHRHLAYMIESQWSKPEKIYFNALPSSISAIDYLSSRGMDFHSLLIDTNRGRAVVSGY
ncbi:tRNA-dihydrouridine synthase 4, partial [Tremellales sp. Uapishka_1]